MLLLAEGQVEGEATGTAAQQGDPGSTVPSEQGKSYEQTGPDFRARRGAYGKADSPVLANTLSPYPPGREAVLFTLLSLLS